VEEKSIINAETTFKILRNFSFNISCGYNVGTTLTFLLFLKGAASKNTPNSLMVSITTREATITATKGELLTSYFTVTKTEYLRRLAEYLATDISKFAEKYNKDGDLASQITLSLPSEEQPLTASERAWCSSFNQRNATCRELFPRVAKLLTANYNKKFAINRTTVDKKSHKSSPKKGGQPKKGGKKATKSSLPNGRPEDQRARLNSNKED